MPPAAAILVATALAQLGTTSQSVAGRLLPCAGSLALNLLLLVVMLQVLTGMPVPWRRLLPGAAAGALGWSVL
jgi:hypothetical protein